MNERTARTRRFKRTAKGRKFAAGVGLNVRAQRGQRHMTQAALAKRLDTDVPTVSRIESGERDLRTSELYEVGLVLGVPPRVLVDVESNGNGNA